MTQKDDSRYINYHEILFGSRYKQQLLNMTYILLKTGYNDKSIQNMLCITIFDSFTRDGVYKDIQY